MLSQIETVKARRIVNEDAVSRRFVRHRFGQQVEQTGCDLAKKVNERMAGIPDPATLAVREDQQRYGTPTIDRR